MSPRPTLCATGRGRNTRWGLLILAATVTVTACDCEDQIRKLVSNKRVDRKMADTTATDAFAELEPNNDPKSATPIQILKELRELRGSIPTSDDVDWWSFASSVETTLEVIVQPSSELDIAVLAEVSGAAPLVYNEAAAGGVERIATLKIAATPQRIGIKSQSGLGTYSINFRRQLAAEGMEAEPNDEVSVATAFSLPGELAGTFDRPDDRDVYRLTGDAGKPFELEIGPVRGGRIIARIFDEDRFQKPALTVQIADVPVSIPNLGLDTTKPTWLVLTPLGTPPADRVYRLKSTAHPPVTGHFELEPNDERPQPLPFGEPDDRGIRRAKVSGYIHSADDRDRFELTPPAIPPSTNPIPPEREEPDYLARFRTKPRPKIPLSARLTWVGDQESFGLKWHSADNTPIEFLRLSTALQVDACGLNLEHGPATIEVRAERLNAAPVIGKPQYELTVEESSAGDDFEAEPNDTRETADAIETSRRGTFAMFEDVDVYAFAVNAADGESRKVQVAASSRNFDLVLRVLDDGGGVVANVDAGPLGAREVVDLDLPDGLYFAELRFKGGDLCSPYTIEIKR